MRMNMALYLLPALLGTCLWAQVTAPLPTRMAAPSEGAAQPLAASELAALLPELQQTAQDINSDMRRLRIEKWKADSAEKRQAQDNADSISRNVSAALPTILAQVRENPQSLAAAFKLYRNLSALYDVFGEVTESAGAFGSDAEYAKLAADATNLGRLHRAVGDRVEILASLHDNELVRLRAQLIQIKAPPPSPPPKKIIVDDQESAKPAKKKAIPKPAATSH